jgi:hypothetical protein
MDTDKTDNPIKEVLDGLFTLLETLETRSAAVLEFLKDQGIATDEKLAPYLERAGSASSVKWRAARARTAYLLAPAPKASDHHEQPAEKQAQRQDAEPTEAVSKNVGSKQDGPRDASPGDAPHKEAATRGAATSEREPRETETKPPETKEPVAKVTDRAKTQETGRKAQAKSDTQSSGSVSGGDGVDADSQQSAKGTHPFAKSKVATAGRADENEQAPKANSQDAPARSKK